MTHLFKLAWTFITMCRGQYTGLVALWLLVGWPLYIIYLLISGGVESWRGRDTRSPEQKTQAFSNLALLYKRQEEASKGTRRKIYRQRRMECEEELERLTFARATADRVAKDRQISHPGTKKPTPCFKPLGRH